MRIILHDTVEQARARKTQRLAARQKRMVGIPTEQQEQISLFQWAELAERYLPEVKYLYAIANEGGRLKNLRYAGVKRGVPDLNLPVARDGFHSLYIELKRRKEGRVAPEQSYWIAILTSLGHRCIVAYGWDEAKDAIVAYLGKGEG